MPSPASGARRAAEWALRAAALALVALAIWRATRPAPAAVGAATVRGAELERRLPAWAAAGAPDSLGVTLDSVPGPAARAWLGALRAAGVNVAWRGDSLVPLAVSLTPRRHPRGGTRVALAAPAGSAVALGDAAGVLDTTRVVGPGASLAAGPGLGRVRASARGTATAALVDSAPLRRVLVIGTAGWEAKFAVAALEEDGWVVDARLAVAPGVTVAQGAAGGPDTARHSAVVALDSLGAADAARVARFVRAGGGLVLAPAAAASPGLAALAVGGSGAAARGVAGALASAAPTRGLDLRPVAALRPGAVVLDRDARGAAVAARRVGVGRVVQSGYGESWRWRMEGGADAVAAHRAWWSRLVGAVAYVPVGGARREAAGAGTTLASDPAPYAALVGELGAPAPGAATATRAASAAGPALGWPLFLLIVAALLVEWAARRARGAR